MKWTKHYTDALDDPFIVALMDEFSHAGYVAYFGLIEIIGKENGHKVTGELEIDPIYLKRKLRISTRKLEQIFGFCQTKGKLKFDKSPTKVQQKSDFSKVLWRFIFTKMVEIKDNYTQDLEATAKKVSIEKEVEEEKEVDKEKTKDLSPKEQADEPELMDEVAIALADKENIERQEKKSLKKRLEEGFDNLWDRYPRKEGRKQAYRHFMASVSNETDFLDICQALKNYLIKIQVERVEPQYIKHGSTWFNNWKDYVNYEPPEKTGTSTTTDAEDFGL